MQQETKRLTDEAFEVWVELMRLINELDEKENGDELTIIHNNFAVDDDDFYIECGSERMHKAIGIFDDGSVSISVIGRRGYDDLDYHNFYDGDEIIDLSVIVEDFLKR
jgi:hypothetical protein